MEEKKEEIQDFRDEILNVDEKVLQRLAKIKSDKKTAVKAATKAATKAVENSEKTPRATPRKKSIKDS